MTNEQDYFLRGNSFLYEEMQPHFVIKWIEPIQIEKLQESVQEVINKSPWVCWSVTDRAHMPKLVKAKGPFLVHDCYKKRPIPETFGGYLFSVSCQNDTIHFVYDHFLTDGRGIVWFISEILLAYCNRVYGLCIPYTPMRSLQLPEFSELLKYASQNPRRESVIPLSRYDQKSERLLLRIDKNEIVQKAVSLEIKPFALLLSIFFRTVMYAKNLSSISYSFALDARKGFNCEDVFYNFSTGIHNTISCETEIAGLHKHFHDMVSHVSEPTAVREYMAQEMQPLNALSEMNVSHIVKRKVYKKLSSLERVTFRTSYLGTVFKNEYGILNQYVSDFMIWLDSDHEEFVFLETTLNDQAIVTLSHCMQNSIVSNCLIKALNENDIKNVQIIDCGKNNAADRC